MTKAYFILILTSFVVAGCGTTQVKRGNLGKVIEPQESRLILSTKNIVSVGDVMLRAGEYSKEGIKLETETFNLKDSQTTSVKHKQHTFIFSIPSGEYLLYSQNNEGSYYASEQPFSGLKGTKDGYGGLFVPNGSPSATEFYWNWNKAPNVLFAHQAMLLTPINGSIGKTSSALKNKNASIPSATLTYAGVASAQVRFVYKEFTADGYARPAFTQEVSLDYKPGGTYAYKSALFKVYKADSTSINFEIINPLY
ncbi:hypothetical protein [Acinetobacter terrae]|uniref:Uncharacterized protein n=1 Tax=Acinetobacter terrae TaxID=2731247 RepID=A0A8E4F6M3_9GAMM|nr:hypothetical protein [Acinetobacter terrae]NNH37744.1 hypothetical protein [Acinetobacter terrae]